MKCHGPILAGWRDLEMMFLGYEKEGGLGRDCQVEGRELRREDYQGFVERCMGNPCWGGVTKGVIDGRRVNRVMKQLRNEVPKIFHREWEGKDGFLERLEMLEVVHA
jgi:hypothetical protein